MTLRSRIERLYERHEAEFLGRPEVQAVLAGTASREAYEQFVSNVVRTHLRSSQLVAFLYALAPPASVESRLQNLMEELSHPGLLRQFAAGAGLAHRLPELEAQAVDDIRSVVADPILYGSLKELGLAALAEIVAFEHMLSRTAGQIAAALATHRHLSARTLAWWTEHAEVDRQHAEEGLTDLETYVRFYEIDAEDAQAIVEMTLRENVFVKRYLGEGAAARTRTERAA